VTRPSILIGTSAFFLVLAIVFRQVLVPFVIGVVLAYVLYPIVEWFHRRRILKRQVPRWVAVLILYAILFGALSVFATTLLPRLGSETAALVRAAPGYVTHVKNDWVPQAERWLGARMGPLFGQPGPDDEEEPAAPITVPPPVIRIQPAAEGGYDVVLPGEGIVIEEVDSGHYRIGATRDITPQPIFGLSRQLDDLFDRALAEGEQHAMTAIRYTQQAIVLTVEVIFDTVLSLMLAAFILATSPTVMGFFRSLFPPKFRPDFDQLMKRVDRGLGGVIRGQLIICLINGVLSGIGFAIAGLRYWPVWTVVATVASIVPIFGTIISSIPAVAIGLSQGWGTGLFVLIWIVAIHELEANVLNPKIMGDAAKMHPVIVVFALLAGAHAFGVLGALLGVPVASMIQSLFRFLRARAYDESPSEVECAEPRTPPPDASGAPE
jgi:predicted PurR-regulated permease PerM